MGTGSRLDCSGYASWPATGDSECDRLYFPVAIRSGGVSRPITRPVAVPRQARLWKRQLDGDYQSRSFRPPTSTMQSNISALHVENRYAVTCCDRSSHGTAYACVRVRPPFSRPSLHSDIRGNGSRDQLGMLLLFSSSLHPEGALPRAQHRVMLREKLGPAQSDDVRCHWRIERGRLCLLHMLGVYFPFAGVVVVVPVSRL